MAADNVVPIAEFFQIERTPRVPRDLQPELPLGPANSVGLAPASVFNFVETLTIEEALRLQARILTAAIGARVGKEIADKGDVSRWCSGKGNPNLAKLLAHLDVRCSLGIEILRTVPGTEIVLSARVPR